MSWSTELFCNISFKRESFNSIHEVQNRIDELERMISNIKSYIKNLVMITEPKKFIDDEYDPVVYFTNECEAQFEELKEYTIELFKLNILLNEWSNCHNEKGLAIYPPENIDSDTAYLCGDFVRSTKFPDINP